MKRALLILIIALVSNLSYAQNLYKSSFVKITSASEERNENDEMILSGDNKVMYTFKVNSYEINKIDPYYLSSDNLLVILELDNLTVLGNSPNEYVNENAGSNFNWSYNASQNKIVGKLKDHVRFDFNENITFNLTTKNVFNRNKKTADVKVTTYLDCPNNKVSCLKLKKKVKLTVKDIDEDNDGIIDELDNCISTANPDQADHDDDGVGNVCDPDYVDVTLTSSDVKKHIEFSSTSKIVAYKIYTLTGKVIKKGKVNNNQTRIKTPKKMKKGKIYVIHFITENGVIVKKKVLKV